MPQAQIERLQQDAAAMGKYAEKLKKRGLMDRVSKILEKKQFLDRRLAELTN